MHDGDVVPMLAALGLFEDAERLPVGGAIPADRAWATSQVTPMGGRITFERLVCGAQRERFVRINVNDGIVPLPGCAGGPGASCALADFIAHVDRRSALAGRFADVCGLPDDSAPGPTFLRQPGFPKSA